MTSVGGLDLCLPEALWLKHQPATLATKTRSFVGGGGSVDGGAGDHRDGGREMLLAMPALSAVSALSATQGGVE